MQTSDHLEMLLREFEQKPAFATVYLRRVQDSKARDSLEDLFPLFASVLMTSSDRDQIQLTLDLMTKAGVAIFRCTILLASYGFFSYFAFLQGHLDSCIFFSTTPG